MKSVYAVTLLFGIGFILSMKPLLSQAADFPSVCLKPLTSQKHANPCEYFPDHKRYQFIALGFSPTIQNVLEDGLKKGLILEKRYPGRLQAVEIPIVAPQYNSAKTAITVFMKGKVKDKNLLSKIYPWYINPQLLRKSLQLSQESEYVFIFLNKSGTVIWKTQKALTLNDIKMVEYLMDASEGSL